LANDLFNIAAHRQYWDFLNRYPGAKVLAQPLARRITAGEVNIEEELRHYADHTNPQVRSHFKHIPPYLRDLIYATATGYTFYPSSYVELLIELFEEHPHDILFIVLNYDHLLEMALKEINSQYTFTKLSDYVDDGRQVRVVKLHGSINWFVHLTDDLDMNWVDAVEAHDLSKRHSDSDVIIGNITQVGGERLDRHLVYPILTAPLAGKGISDAVCPSTHLDTVREFIPSCNKFLIIGCSGLDEDLMHLMDSVVSTHQTHLVHFVGMGDGAHGAADRFRNSVPALSSDIPRGNVFTTGFRSYLGDKHFRSFAMGLH